MIISLTRRGSIDYAVEMCRRIKIPEKIMIFSAGAEGEIPGSALKIRTYGNHPFSFIMASFVAIFRIPFLLLKIVRSEDPQLMHFPVFHPWNLLFIIYGRFWGLKSVLTIHDAFLHTGEKNYFIYQIQLLSARLSHRLIFLSHSEKDKWTGRYHSFIKKSSVWPHPPIDYGARNSLPYNPRPGLLFLGRAKAYKGIDMLLSAVEGLEISHLTIAGEGASHFANKDNARIRIMDRYLSRREIRSLLEKHEILVLPYKEASQSGVLAAGKAAAMVMVITRVGGLPEQLGANEAVWVESGVASLRDGLRRLIEDPGLYERTKKNVGSYFQQG